MNVPSLTNIDTTLAATPSHLLLDPVSDNDYGSTAVRVRRTVYVPIPFFLILLADNLIPVEARKRLWGSLLVANLEADCSAVVEWIRVALVRSAPDALSHLVTADPTAPLSVRASVVDRKRHVEFYVPL